MDRGNSDFDQRQNLVIFSYWNLPSPFASSKWGSLLRDWTFGELAAFRSGFPYTVYGTSAVVPGGGLIINNRVNIVDPNETTLPNPIPGAGRRAVAQSGGFRPKRPQHARQRRTQRLHWPGILQPRHFAGSRISIALAGRRRPHPIPRRRLQRPEPRESRQSGRSLHFSAIVDVWNRHLRPAGFPVPGFPAVSPLNETPRQIQLSIRVEF